MRRRTKKGLIVATLLASTVATFWLWRAPSSPQGLDALLSNAGFENTSLPEEQSAGGAQIFENITLDPDGFSKIGKIAIEKNLTGGWKKITIENLDLTGELHEGLEIIIAGWNRAHAHVNLPKGAGRPIIEFKNARLSLLHPSLGGINLKADLQLTPKDKEWDFSARLEGAQTQLSYNALAQGTITDQGFWQSIIDVQQAKFALGLLRGTRISGKINLTGEQFSQSQIIGELQAGGLNILGLPWENASLTLEGSLTQTSMVIGAKSAGIDGLEFGLTLDSLQNADTYSGMIHADFLKQLFDYLAARNALFFERDALKPLDQLEMLDVNFSGNRRTFRFDVSQNNEPLIIDGDITSIDENTTLRDIGRGLPLSLTARTDKGALSGTLALSQDGKSLVTLPEGKVIKPKLKDGDSLIDILK